MKSKALAKVLVPMVLAAFPLATGCGQSGGPDDGSGGGGGDEARGGGDNGAGKQGGSGGAAKPSGAGGQAMSGGSGGTASSGAGGQMPAVVVDQDGDEARWDFEDGTDDWQDWGSSLDPRMGREGGLHDPVASTERALAGKSSLKYGFDTTTGGGAIRYVAIVGQFKIGNLKPGNLITYNVWLPEKHGITGVQAFLVGLSVPWNSVNQHQVAGGFGGGKWNTFQLTIPDDYEGHEDEGLFVGMQFAAKGGAWKGDLFIDSIDIETK